MLWHGSAFPCDSRYAVRSQADSQLCMGSLNGSDQLVEICRQLMESPTVIADTRQSSASISCHIVAIRTLLVATRQNSASISCYIVATCTQLVGTRAMSPYLTTQEKPRH